MKKVRRWFGVDKTLDGEIRTRFGDLLQKARDGALDDWAKTPRGRLGLIILLERPTHAPWPMMTRTSDVALPSGFPDVALQPLMAGRAGQSLCAFAPRIADIPAVAADAGCALGASGAAPPRRACPSLQFHVRNHSQRCRRNGR